MRFFHSLKDYRKTPKGLALAIGNFDGFHIGHQSVIKRTIERAHEFSCESAVMIFEPQPLEFFGKTLGRLYSLREKIMAFEKAGIENVFCLRFTKDFAALEPEAYTLGLLYETLGVKSVTVGTLFNFGRGGKAGIEELTAIGKTVGMQCEAIAAVELDGSRVSSTFIRELLEKGDFEKAQRALGHEYTLAGRVAHGHEVARDLGYRTANINLKRLQTVLDGVYAVRVKTRYGDFGGVANVGKRPTMVLNQEKSLLEVHLLDFDQDLYGQCVEVTFLSKIRGEIKFGCAEELKRQIGIDRDEARRMLSAKC